MNINIHKTKKSIHMKVRVFSVEDKNSLHRVVQTDCGGSPVMLLVILQSPDSQHWPRLQYH